MDRQDAVSQDHFEPADRISSRSRLRILALALGTALLLPGAAVGQAGPAVPVRVGGDRDLPACEARGTLNASEASGERVDIRSGPTPSFRPLDRVPVGLEVYVCDENGTHIGIIYGDGDCGLAEPIARRAAYRGACASGWVHNGSVDPSDGGAA